MKFLKLLCESIKLESTLKEIGFQWDVNPVVERYLHISSPSGELLYKIREGESESFLSHVGVCNDNEES
jgi:hypothetical protein